MKTMCLKTKPQNIFKLLCEPSVKSLRSLRLKIRANLLNPFNLCSKNFALANKKHTNE
jgi:hypothetical protein